MKVRSKAVYEATRITEGMVRNAEPLPVGVRLARKAVSGDGTLLSYKLAWVDDEGYSMGIRIGDWWVAGDGANCAKSDAEFREEFEEVGP